MEITIDEIKQEEIEMSFKIDVIVWKLDLGELLQFLNFCALK